MLITTVVAVAAWIFLAGGIFLSQSSWLQMLNTNKMEEQARQYGQVDAKLLRLVDYDKLTDSSTLADFKLHMPRGKIQTIDAPDWEDEISFGNEQSASTGGAYRVASISVYYADETEPRAKLNIPIVRDAQWYTRKQVDKIIEDTKAALKAEIDNVVKEALKHIPKFEN